MLTLYVVLLLISLILLLLASFKVPEPPAFSYFPLGMAFFVVTFLVGKL